MKKSKVTSSKPKTNYKHGHAVLSLSQDHRSVKCYMWNCTVALIYKYPPRILLQRGGADVQPRVSATVTKYTRR